MRKLASIRRIAEIKPIEGADAIEAVRVDGWWCVAKKGEFQLNDLCVYFEIDSFLPVRPEFEFLRKNCFKSTQHLGDGFRLRTVKLRGQVSQGLALPLSNFPKEFVKEYKLWLYNNFDESTSIAIDICPIPVGEGDDVTELLGVKKWEMPIPAQLAGQIKGDFPSFIRKTDQERAQNLFEEYQEKYKDEPFEATVKLDGSSMTVYWNNGQFGVCSRNLDLKETENNTYWRVARESGLEGILSKLGRNVALQGELMGPGIQGNRENLKKHEFFLFDIWNIDEQRYLDPAERYTFKTDMNEISFAELWEVPYIGVVKPFRYTLEELLEMADKTESLTNSVAEGIVFKGINVPVSFKIISNKFLLGEK